MKTKKYKVYSNLNDYVSKNNFKKEKLTLSDTDIKMWQSIIPNEKLTGALLNSKKIVTADLFNVSSIFNEAGNFSAQYYDDLEASFKADASFLTGMIMAAIYANKKLNVHEIYHYNYMIHKKGGKKPDFIVRDVFKKYSLVEAKCSSNRRVSKKAVKKGIDQVLNNKTKYNIVGRYVVVMGFIGKNFTFHLDIIKLPNSNSYENSSNSGGDSNPNYKLNLKTENNSKSTLFEENYAIECIRKMYSKIDFKDIPHLKTKSEIPFYLVNSNIKDIEITVGLYKKFDKGKTSVEDWNEFSKNIPSYYEYFQRKYKDIIFYNGVMIAYNNKILENI